MSQPGRAGASKPPSVGSNPTTGSKTLYLTEVMMHNLPLKNMALAIARQHGHDGAIIITKSDEGYHIGVAGLSDHDVQEALCVGIHHNFRQMEQNSRKSNA